MAKGSGLAMSFFFQGFDLSGCIAALDNMGSPRTFFDVTGINKSSIERIYGKIDSVLDFTSHFNKCTGAEHLALRTLPTTDVDTLILLQGGAKGSSSGMIIGKQVNYDWSRGADGSLSLTGNVSASGAGWEYGTVLLAKATISGTGNSASEDNCASSNSGLAAQLHLSAFTGTDYTATIQDSTNDTCFCTLKAFAQITAINKSERVTVAGTVNQFLRINHAGTFCSVDVVVATRRGICCCGDREVYAN